MAVGMANSQTNAPKVLRLGEAVASSVKDLADKNAKVYHHMVPGARFIMPDGLEIKFLGGVYATSDAEQIAELDKVADKTSSMIFTKKEVADAVTNQVKQAAQEAATQK